MIKDHIIDMPGIIPGITDMLPLSILHVSDEICKLSVAVPETYTVGVIIIELSGIDMDRLGTSPIRSVANAEFCPIIEIESTNTDITKKVLILRTVIVIYH